MIAKTEFWQGWEYGWDGPSIFPFLPLFLWKDYYRRLYYSV